MSGKGKRAAGAEVAAMNKKKLKGTEVGRHCCCCGWPEWEADGSAVQA